MTYLSTFLESLLNILSNNLKKYYKIWYSQGEKRCQNLNGQNHSICNLPGKFSWLSVIYPSLVKVRLNF